MPNLADKKPAFPESTDAWNFDHLAISPSMGGAGTEPIDLDKERPERILNTCLHEKDLSGNKTYTQRILAHALYLYSVRPDLHPKIKDFICIKMSTEFDSGQGSQGLQGGILNIPMIQKYTRYGTHCGCST
jgi:hypothetical protein